ncbi:MAG: YggT family protein [Anaerolineae bacterium]|nr:YggT family protein [Anaerolineae bacterium]MCA9887355.1 YggT family protein [Anaerolineae bacterium]MCA9892015.1 YggT family protein [Anaerolineae bacterium]
MSMIITILLWAIQIYMFILVARSLMTWIPNLDYSNPIVRLLFDITEPVLRPVRQRLPSGNGVDFSPLVVLVGLMLVRVLLTSFMWSL